VKHLERVAQRADEDLVLAEPGPPWSP